MSHLEAWGRIYKPCARLKGRGVAFTGGLVIAAFSLVSTDHGDC